MSLATNVQDLAVRSGTELKRHLTLINGNVADLSALDTTAKTNLVAAINEVRASTASTSRVDDSQTSTTSPWSSSKTRTEIDGASTVDRDRANHSGTQSASTVDETDDRKWLLAAERSKLAGVAAGATANAADSALRDRATHTGVQESATISDFAGAVDARIALRVDGAPAALDTFRELADALGNDPNYAASTAAALGSRVRFDAAQSLSGPQAAQARANIGAASAADLGDVTQNPVAAFEAALV